MIAAGAAGRVKIQRAGLVELGDGKKHKKTAYVVPDNVEFDEERSCFIARATHNTMSRAAQKDVLDNTQQIKAYLSQPDLDQDILNHIYALTQGIINRAGRCKVYRRKRRQPALA